MRGQTTGFLVHVPGRPKPVQWPGANWQNCPFGHWNGRMPPHDCGFGAACAPATSRSEAKASKTVRKANLRNMLVSPLKHEVSCNFKLSWSAGRDKRRRDKLAN